MRFPLDEYVSTVLVRHLRHLGHDVATLAEDYPQARGDEKVLAVANGERRNLVTNDLDFGTLVFQVELPRAGVILLWLGAADAATRQRRLDHVLTHHARDLEQFVVVSERGVRVRRSGRS